MFAYILNGLCEVGGPTHGRKIYSFLFGEAEDLKCMCMSQIKL